MKKERGMLGEEEKKPKNWEKEEAKEVSHQNNLAATEMKEKNNVKEPNPKGNNQHRVERRRAARRSKRGDPIVEKIKEAWESPQKNQDTSAALRFRFGRLCKVRHE